ncbi:hypothetical protein [Williamsia sp. D3]|uniref:hypothetical protein n=1 Tax=Williamsia sp. D3 TaxID=1313067 RepID=UPI0003D384B9|nr:hypothetical protein [Williamsia sp. D3]ETD33665.1 hypothetical protein W823_07170 [Williamsia sp. D3]
MSVGAERSSPAVVWGGLAVAVLVMGLCAGAVTWAWHVDGYYDLLEANRSQAQQQAGPLVAQVFSFATDTYGQDRERARSLVTDEFAEQYATSLDPAAVPDYSVSWTPIETGISDVGTDHAELVVSAEVAQTRTGTEPARYVKAVEVRLEKVGGDWKLARADEVL